jgi:hypothetical protein
MLRFFGGVLYWLVFERYGFGMPSEQKYYVKNLDDVCWQGNFKTRVV